MKAISFLFIVFTCLLSHASDVNFPVAVNVTGAVSNEINSYIKRELRDLKDVSMVDSEDATIILEIVSLETRNEAGTKTGYALSIVITSRYPKGFWSNFGAATSHPLSSQDVGALQSLTDDLVRVEDHEIRTLPRDQLKMVCQGIAARLDSELLEKRRLAISKFNDLVNAAARERGAVSNASTIDVGAGTNAASAGR